MGKSSGSAPAAPDPYTTAAAQGAEDRKTLQYSLENSRTSTVNPFGSTRWTNEKTFDQAGFDRAMAAYNTPRGVAPSSSGGLRGLSKNRFGGNFTGEVGDPSIPYSATTGAKPLRSAFEGPDNWVNTQELSPESQGIYDSATSRLAQATDNISTDADAYNQQVADAIYGRMRRYQDPEDAQARSTLQSNLADRGFQVGNEGFNTEMTRLDDSQSRGRADAADQSVIQGMTQGRAQLSMQQQIAQALSALRNQQVAGVAGMPTATTTPSIQAPDIAGMINANYANQMNAYNARQQSNDNQLGGLLSLGTSIALAPQTGGGSLIGNFFK